MNEPRIIPVGQEPPPMDPRPPRPAKTESKAKEKTKRRQTGNRFGVLNAFLDMTAGALTRAELLTWLILYRDTKADGTARTSQADLARRGRDGRTDDPTGAQQADCLRVGADHLARGLS